MQCPKCSSKKHVKNWSANWNPRKKCKDCWCSFTKSEPRWKSQTMKKLALVLYLEWLWFRSIWRVLWVSNVAVIKWIKNIWNTVEQIRTKQEKPNWLSVMQFDEMWHYYGKKNRNYGYGLLSMKHAKNQLILSYDADDLKHEKNSGIK